MFRSHTRKQLSVHCERPCRSSPARAAPRRTALARPTAPPQVTSGGGSWNHVRLEAPAQCSNGSPLAEFVITDGRDNWDKAAEGAREGPGRLAG